MHALDILGNILRNTASRSRRGTEVHTDLLPGGSSRKSGATPSARSRGSNRNIKREAADVEGLLNVAHQRLSQPQASSRSSGTIPSRPTGEVAWMQPGVAGADTSSSLPDQAPGESEQRRARVLFRAMVNAAKADGQVDEAEQQTRNRQMGSPTRERIDLLKVELGSPFDIKDFTRSVPIGMGQQVDTLSSITIDLDTLDVAESLSNLAHGLRLDPSIRDQIHQRFGGPPIR